MLIDVNTAALARALPDVPRWVEVRAMLLGGECDVFGDESTNSGYVVISHSAPLGAVVGKPCAQAFASATAFVVNQFELLVPPDAVEQAAAALPHWKNLNAVLHTRSSMIEAPGRISLEHPDVELLSRDDALQCANLAAPMRGALTHATIVAAKRVENQIVAACHTSAITETLWDVGVDTLEIHRRKGYAQQCFEAMNHYMQRLGKRPVWGAVQDNAASMNLAAKLGFEPVDRIAVFLAPQHDQSAASPSRHSR